MTHNLEQRSRCSTQYCTTNKESASSSMGHVLDILSVTPPSPPASEEARPDSGPVD